MSKDFKQMSTEELRTYMDEHQDDETGELAFIEYSSRLNWKRVPPNASPQQEKQIIEDLIASKTKPN